MPSTWAGDAEAASANQDEALPEAEPAANTKNDAKGSKSKASKSSKKEKEKAEKEKPKAEKAPKKSPKKEKKSDLSNAKGKKREPEDASKNQDVSKMFKKNKADLEISSAAAPMATDT